MINQTVIFTKNTEPLKDDSLPLHDVPENEIVATVWDEKCSFR